MLAAFLLLPLLLFILPEKKEGPTESLFEVVNGLEKKGEEEEEALRGGEGPSFKTTKTKSCQNRKK